MHENLTGRTILFLGSSVTYGWASGGESFVDMLAACCGCRTVREAVSGATLVDNGPDSYIARMKGMDAALTADLFICQLSTNDATKGLPLGETDGRGDTSTVAGAIETVIRYARDTWHCPVAFYTNPRYDSPAYEKMVALLKECGDLYGIHIIDLWDEPAINDLSQEQRAAWMADEIHPTRAGYQRWLPIFERRIREILEAGM